MAASRYDKRREVTLPVLAAGALVADTKDAVAQLDLQIRASSLS
jgi:hypothetical protein